MNRQVGYIHSSTKRAETLAIRMAALATSKATMGLCFMQNVGCFFNGIHLMPRCLHNYVINFSQRRLINAATMSNIFQPIMELGIKCFFDFIEGRVFPDHNNMKKPCFLQI